MAGPNLRWTSGGGPAATTREPNVVNPVGGQALGQIFQMFGSQMFPNIQFGQMFPEQSFYDQTLGLHYQQQKQLAMAAAMEGDRHEMVAGASGWAKMLTGEDVTPERRAQFEKMSKDYAKFGPMIMQTVGTARYNQGFSLLTGEQSGMAGAASILAGGQLLNDPTTGSQGFSGKSAADLMATMRGSHKEDDPVERAMRFEQLAKFGLVDQSGGLKGMSEQAFQYAGVQTAARELFGPTATHAQMFQGVQNMTQGGLNTMSPVELETALRDTQSTMQMTGLGLGQMMGLRAQGAATADALGLSRSLVGGIADRSAMYGKALMGSGAIGVNFGQSSVDKLRLMDQGLRSGAAASPLVNQMASVVAMQDAGLFGADRDKDGKDKDGKLNVGHQLAEAIKRGDTTFNGKSLAHMRTGELMELMGKAGVSSDVVAAALRDTEGNQEFTKKHDLDVTGRKLQFEADVLPTLSDAAAGGIRTQLVGAGMGGQKAFDMSGEIAESAVREVFENMSPEDQNDPAKRRAAIAKVIGEKTAAAGFTLNEKQLNSAAFTADKRMAQAAEKQLPGSYQDQFDLHGRSNLAQHGGLLVERNTETALRKALGGVGDDNMFIRMGKAARAGATFKEMAVAAAGAIDTTTDAGKEYLKIMTQFTGAERDGKTLTPEGLASRADAIAKMQEIAPELTRGGAVKGSQELKPSKDVSKNGGKLELGGTLKLQGLGKAIMDASASISDAESSTPTTPSNDEAATE